MENTYGKSPNKISLSQLSIICKKQETSLQVIKIFLLFSEIIKVEDGLFDENMQILHGKQFL